MFGVKKACSSPPTSAPRPARRSAVAPAPPGRAPGPGAVNSPSPPAPVLVPSPKPGPAPATPSPPATPVPGCPAEGASHPRGRLPANRTGVWRERGTGADGTDLSRWAGGDVGAGRTAGRGRSRIGRGWCGAGPRIGPVADGRGTLRGCHRGRGRRGLVAVRERLGTARIGNPIADPSIRIGLALRRRRSRSAGCLIASGERRRAVQGIRRRGTAIARGRSNALGRGNDNRGVRLPRSPGHTRCSPQ